MQCRSQQTQDARWPWLQELARESVLGQELSLCTFLFSAPCQAAVISYCSHSNEFPLYLHSDLLENSSSFRVKTPPPSRLRFLLVLHLECRERPPQVQLGNTMPFITQAAVLGCSSYTRIFIPVYFLIVLQHCKILEISGQTLYFTNEEIEAQRLSPVPRTTQWNVSRVRSRHVCYIIF